MHFLSQQPIDKKMPTLHILYFIQKQIGKISLNLVEDFEQIIQLGCLHVCQPFVIKINVGKFHTTMMQGLIAQGGLSTSPHSDNDLCLCTF